MRDISERGNEMAAAGIVTGVAISRAIDDYADAVGGCDPGIAINISNAVCNAVAEWMRENAPMLSDPMAFGETIGGGIAAGVLANLDGEDWKSVADAKKDGSAYPGLYVLMAGIGNNVAGQVENMPDDNRPMP